MPWLLLVALSVGMLLLRAYRMRPGASIRLLVCVHQPNKGWVHVRTETGVIDDWGEYGLVVRRSAGTVLVLWDHIAWHGGEGRWHVV